MKGRKYVNKYTYVIWDFNGTILDDAGLSRKCVNRLLSERGLRTLKSTDEYRKIFRFPIIEYYRLAGFDFEKESYEELAPKWVKLYLEYIDEAKLFCDVPRSLDRFHAEGIRQAVISATEISMLRTQLSELGILNRFDGVFGLDNIHAESKVALAKSWRAANPNERVLFLGDTTHDAEVASEIGADCVLIARGHQLRSTLEKCGVPVKNSLDEIDICAD